MTHGARPPTPPGSWLFGNLREFADPIEAFPRWARVHGDVVRLRLLHHTAYLISHPDLIEEVLVTNNKNFVKHRFSWRQVRAVFGDGLFTSEGDLWLGQRRLMQPAFHRDRIAGYGAVMVALAEGLTQSWRDGETRNLHEDLMGLTFTIVARVLCGSREGALQDFGRAVNDLADLATHRLARPVAIPDIIPLPGNLRYRRAVRRVDDVVFRMIREHRTMDDTGDLLSLLLGARDDDGRSMGDRQLRDEVVTLLLAGHETTALALSWTFYLLARNPAVEEILADELRTVLLDRAPTAEDVPRLRYADMVIKESMRLFPPVYSFGREAVTDCELGGFSIPARSTLFMSPWVAHRDPRFFEEPEEFRPERWTDDFARRLPKFAYFPFGGGPRLCLGNRFAMMEAVLLLATIVRRVRLSLLPGHVVTLVPSLTLRPGGGMPVRIERRSP